MPGYAELHCLSNFSFLTGASHPEELVERAHALGYAALAVTDQCSLAGIVRAHLAARACGLPLVVGSEITLEDGPRLVLLAEDREGYGNLSELITAGRRRAVKGEYRLARADLARGLPRCTALWLADEASAPEDGRWLAGLFPGRCWIAVELHRSGGDRWRLDHRRALAQATGLPLVATGGALMHERARQPLQDVLTAIRLGVPVDAAGLALQPNAERHLRTLADLARFYPAELLAESLAVAARCRFSLDELRYEYPAELVPDGRTPAGHLRALTEQGLRTRWPEGAPAKVRQLVEHELALIAELRYEPYFLTVHDIVGFARSRGILCQGRGSAANSAVCYCLGVTEVDPARSEMLFERFLSKERNEPPDIDVDFEHQRREEVIQYVYAKYGRHRAALAATVICYRPKSAVRDVGKAMGLDPDQIDRLAKGLAWWDGRAIAPERLREAGLDPDNPRVALVMQLVHALIGFPRHLSQHVGGFVITRDRLSRLVPVENAVMPERTVIQWDKDDLDALGLLKIDCLALGMLTAIHRAFDLVNRWREYVDRNRGLEAAPTALRQPPGSAAQGAIAEAPLHRGLETDSSRPGGRSYHDTTCAMPVGAPSTARLQSRSSISARRPLLPRRANLPVGAPSTARSEPLGLHNVPAEDPAVYAMIQRAETVGVFQIESRAQMAMLPRLRPERFYDLVIEVAIVRPGPIQGDMVHPYLRRRQGLEPVTYPSEEIRDVLGRTLGVPLFQEQVIKVAMVAAGFSPGEADQVRRSMAAWRRRGGLESFRQRLLDGMTARGYTLEFAQQIYRQILGFGEYGFPESHAASFALLVYVSAWLKCHEPAAFFAAMLNSQPLGFYAPAQLVREARRQGVEVRPADVRCSEWDCTLEPATDLASSQPALRLGLRLVKGLARDGAQRLTAARAQAAFVSVDDLARRAGLDRRDLGALAAADALHGLAGHRHDAAWRVAGVLPPLPLFESDRGLEAAPTAPRPSPGRSAIHGAIAAPDVTAAPTFHRGLEAAPTGDSGDGDSDLPPLPVPTEGQEIVADYASLGLSLRRHPLALLRRQLSRRGLLPAAEVLRRVHGQRVRTGGLVITRQRPASAQDVTFITLEDESGHINLVVWKSLAERQRPVMLGARLLGVYGEVQREGEVVHVVARRLYDHSDLLGDLAAPSRDFR
jgi:error-prone DNA polymerase